MTTSGTNGFLDTSKIAVGSNQDNSFDLTQGNYSSSSASPAGPPSKIDVSFNSNEDSLVVKVLDTTTITTVAEGDVTIKVPRQTVHLKQ